ncbi:MAG: hypothetical protein ACLFN8_02690 [Candidatus Woesearchaeota archaeon]
MKIPSSLKFTGKDPHIVGIGKAKLLRELEEKLKKQKKWQPNIKVDDSINGSIPNLLIGSYNYPNVNTGFLTNNNLEDNDSPKIWSQNKDIKIEDIILKRQSLANSRFNTNVKDNTKFSDKLKEVSLSSKALASEVFFKGNITHNLKFNQDTLPHGPIGELKRIDVFENAKVPFHVQRAESDTDLKANDALRELSKRGIDEHFLTKIISAGNLGVKLERKRVPTKWSITLIDDTLGQAHSKKVMQSDTHPLSFFQGSYLGNYYFALIFEGPFSFELFETYVGDLKNSSNYRSATDYEGSFGRKKYAENTGGGYYASKIAALEYLNKKNMRGRIIMFRFITEEYWAPLGVWVVREASRNAFKEKPQLFDDKDKLIQHAFQEALKKFKINILPLIRSSKLLKEINTQRTLI